MSDFVRQNGEMCSFDGSDSWVILSPIEKSIKRKIEAVGTPLKDWNIQINYGIKTGCNEAFIIDEAKRNEILNNCADEDERSRTAELIRPILRGRDIKRYGYDWAGLYLINTHNGIKGKVPRIKIEDYPAIKAHLDQYWEDISKRADKGDTPYNLRNCAYMEDFNKTQIVWIELSDLPKFSMVNNFTSLNTVFFMTGNNLDHIIGVLNSKIITWYFHRCLGARSGVGTNRWLKYTMEALPIPPVNSEIASLAISLNSEYSSIVNETLDQKIFDAFGLSTDEILYIQDWQ